VPIPSDRNVIHKGAEKNLKFKYLSIKIQRMWNMKCFIIPASIGAIVIVTGGLKKSGDNTRKALNRLSTRENSCTRNIAHNKESATM